MNTDQPFSASNWIQFEQYELTAERIEREIQLKFDLSIVNMLSYSGIENLDSSSINDCTLSFIPIVDK